jgi:hypothetical protein
VNKKISSDTLSKKFALSEVDSAIRVSSLAYSETEKGKEPGNPVLSTLYVTNKHLKSPFGVSIYIYLREGQKKVGHIFLQNRKFIKDGVETDYLLASDLVSKSSLPLGAVKLFKKAITIAEEAGLPLVNFSNNDSSAIYDKMLKMTPSEEFVFRICLTNIMFSKSKYIRSTLRVFSETIRRTRGLFIARQFSFRIIENFTVDLDQCLEKILNEYSFIGYRNSKILNWRFNSSNLQEYVKLQVYSEEELQGYFIFCKREIGGQSIIVLVDFLVLKPSRRVGVAAIYQASKLFPDSNFLVIPSNRNSNSITKLFKFHTLVVPKYFVPQAVPIYITDRASQTELPKIGSHITFFDTDLL